jgi:hypothetical protein
MGSPALRGTIASELSCVPNDLGLARMATSGGGNSFVGIDQPPEKPEDLTKSWQHYQDHPSMKALLGSPKIRRLAAILKIKMPDST